MGMFLVTMLAACSIQEKEPQKHVAYTAGGESVVYVQTANTDTVLYKDQMVERRFVRLPDSPQGARAKALFELISSSEQTAILPFVYEHYDADFIAQVPQKEHKQLLLYLQQQLANAQITSFEPLEGAFRLGLSSDEEDLVLLDVYFAPLAPYKISGVRLL